MVVSRHEEGIRYQPGEIRRWRPYSLIHGAAVAVAPYFAFHENVFVCLNSPECDAGALKYLSYACTRICARACTTCTRHRAQYKHTQRFVRADEISRTYGIHRLFGQSYAIKRRSALSSFRQSVRCASKLIMHTNRRNIRGKGLSSFLSLSLSFLLPIFHSRSEKNISAF